ncbi:MAG: 5-formyltetrahydrofolate cyclo-ligase [Elusimicrobia bacterium]|nr:5-formyltetrahydrofolate cyclo-ligase [Elusimicrobiota bacterium]
MRQKLEIIKSQIRKKYKKIRSQIPKPEQKILNLKIAKQLFKIKEFKKSKRLGIYLSKNNEVSTFLIFKKSLALEKKVAAPKINSNKKINMEFFQIKNLTKDCKEGTYGLLEPKDCCPHVSKEKLELILVPGIVFDSQGFRLGTGIGFYDRFLKKCASSLTIGLTFDKTFVPSLPHEKNDIPVDMVITEKKVYRTPHGR